MEDFNYKKHVNSFDLDYVNSQLEEICEKHDIEAQKLFIVQLVVEELVTNTQKYGSQGGEDETVEVNLEIDDGKAILTIKDNVLEFNPMDAADPDLSLSADARGVGGLGLFLVRKKVHSLHYEYVDNYNIIRAVI